MRALLISSLLLTLPPAAISQAVTIEVPNAAHEGEQVEVNVHNTSKHHIFICMSAQQNLAPEKGKISLLPFLLQQLRKKSWDTLLTGVDRGGIRYAVDLEPERTMNFIIAIRQPGKFRILMPYTMKGTADPCGSRTSNVYSRSLQITSNTH